ncbi:hypothetical protein HPULCUR_004424 [Helicostylum pulchrum]|uniref:Uncharacterized protein n=1 Tax=Helicostylum pulchrum TaxID=562976 RepID=A0ABP9XXA2_9FUNG
MSGTPPPPPSPPPPQKNENCVTGNISNVKEKIINTSKLLKVLTRSKKDIESRTDENSDLRAKVLSLKEQLSSQNEQMENKLQHGAKLEAEKDAQTIKTLREELAQLENKNLITEKALTSNKMYIQQLEAECETLKNEKAVAGSSKLRQDLIKKTQEAKHLSNQVKELRQQVEGLNTKLEESEAENEKLEAENEKLDMQNLALKMEFEEKEEEQNLSSKVEELQLMLKKANKALAERPPNLSSLVDELQSRLNKANKALAEERNEHASKVEELRIKALGVTKALADKLSLAEKQSSTAISPVFMNKIKKLKANHSYLKNENQFLREQIRKKDLQILERQNLEDVLQSSSEDETEDMDVEISTNPSSISSNNAARVKQLNKRDTPPPTRRSSSKCSDYSVGESYLSFGSKIFTDKTPPPPASPHRRISSSSSKSSSSSAAARGSLAKPKISTNDSYFIDLDTYIPTQDASTPIGPTERLPTASTFTERPNTPAKETKAETPNRVTSPATGKAAFRTAGLSVPAPQIYIPTTTASAKTKKPKSKLAKFVNSRNPSKVIDSRPLIVHTAKKRSLSPEKPVPEKSSTSRSASERPVPPAVIKKPVISPSPSLVLPQASTRVVSSRSNEPASTITEVLTVEEPAPKKTKMDTHYVDIVKGWISSKYVISSDDFDKKTIDECLDEIKLNYTSMKSPSDLDWKEHISYGIDDSFSIEVPKKTDVREKAYALLLSLAANKKPELLSHIYNTLYNELKASLKSKRPDTSCARYSRLLCAICKSTEGLERIRTICYDIIRHSICPKNSVICLYNIVAVWKDVLTMTSTDNVVVDTLRVCCNVIAHDNKSPANIKGMYEKMALICNWGNSIETLSLEAAIQKVFDELLKLQHEKDKGSL